MFRVFSPAFFFLFMVSHQEPGSERRNTRCNAPAVPIQLGIIPRDWIWRSHELLATKDATEDGHSDLSESVRFAGTVCCVPGTVLYGAAPYIMIPDGCWLCNAALPGIIFAQAHHGGMIAGNMCSFCQVPLSESIPFSTWWTAPLNT